MNLGLFVWAFQQLRSNVVGPPRSQASADFSTCPSGAGRGMLVLNRVYYNTYTYSIQDLFLANAPNLFYVIAGQSTNIIAYLSYFCDLRGDAMSSFCGRTDVKKSSTIRFCGRNDEARLSL